MENETRMVKSEKEKSRVYPELPRVAVGGVVFRKGRVLLVKRGCPPSLGKWAIPGGSVELGETLHEALEREVLEETGVLVKALKPIYTFDFIEKDENEDIRYHYVIVDLITRYLRGTPVGGDDATDAAWFLPFELSEINISPATRKLLINCFGFGTDPDNRWNFSPEWNEKLPKFFP